MDCCFRGRGGFPQDGPWRCTTPVCDPDSPGGRGVLRDGSSRLLQGYRRPDF